MFVPGPGLGSFAWQRKHVDNRLFSLCGITHTTASHGVMDNLADLFVPPLQPWDALICTSQSVKDMVCKVLDEQANYLQERFQLPTAPKIPLDLQVIPLGVDCDKFAKSAHFISVTRQKWRQSLKIQADDFVVLFVGRLSFHAKAHPMPLFCSLEETAKTTGKKIQLIMAGWFANDAIKAAFEKAAQTYCPSVRVIFIDGRKPEVRETIWYAADVFSSLSDNIQETFGLTPLEAMAAGLPVVITDWDGYRETAQHEKSGFLIPTYAAPPGSAGDVAIAHSIGSMNYDNYIGHQSQFCSVDIQACTQAFTALLKNPDLRKQMGEAGQQRARTRFDWSVIISQYESLWQELAKIRKEAKSYESVSAHSATTNDSTATGATAYGAATNFHVIPARQDPTVLFQSYPTHIIGFSTIVSVTPSSNMEGLAKARLLSMNTFAADRVIAIEEISQIFSSLKKHGSQPVSTLLNLVATNRHKQLILTILWLSKMGLVHLSELVVQ